MTITYAIISSKVMSSTWVVINLSLQFDKWFKAIPLRRSRRTYIFKTIEAEVFHSLNDVIAELNQTYKGVRLLLVERSPDPIFVGAVGPYGKITGAPSFIALVVNEQVDFRYEKGGYIAQGLVLETVDYGLSTCWVGGYFNKEVAEQLIKVNDHERIIAILPFGYARKNYSLTEKMMNQVGDYHKSKSIKETVDGLPMEKWPKWIEKAIYSANLAPSAYNRQSLRYVIEEDHSITIRLDKPEEETNVPKGIDRGIAMLHIELAVNQQGKKGIWEYSENLNTVTFKLNK